MIATSSIGNFQFSVFSFQWREHGGPGSGSEN
jgi:hypothetical protein